MLNPFEMIARTRLAEELHGESDVEFNGKKYIPVGSRVNFAAVDCSYWVSLGSSKSRERLFFDQNSRWFQTLYQAIVNQVHQESIHFILTIVNEEINKLNHVPLQSLREYDRFVDSCLADFLRIQPRDDEQFINVDMTTLVGKKLLVCRHKALIAACILGKLIKDKLLPAGIARQYRSTLDDSGAHSWSVYRENQTNDLWLCDPRWEKAWLVTLPLDPRFNKYGKTCITQMFNRLQRLDAPWRDIERAQSLVKLCELIENPSYDLKTQGGKTLDRQAIIEEMRRLYNDENGLQTVTTTNFDYAVSIITRNFGIRNKFIYFCEQALDEQFIKNIERSRSFSELYFTVDTFQGILYSQNRKKQLDKGPILRDIREISRAPENYLNGKQITFITSNYGLKDKFHSLLSKALNAKARNRP